MTCESDPITWCPAPHVFAVIRSVHGSFVTKIWQIVSANGGDHGNLRWESKPLCGADHADSSKRTMAPRYLVGGGMSAHCAWGGNTAWRQVLNFTMVFSHPVLRSRRFCTLGQDVQSSTQDPKDRSRSVRCQSTSRTYCWSLPSFWLPLVQHVPYVQTQSKPKQPHRNSSLFSRNPFRLNQHIQANTNKSVSGQAYAPVPQNLARVA